MCLSVAVANVEQPKNEIELNVQLAANFLASLLKKNWQNIKVGCPRMFFRFLLLFIQVFLAPSGSVALRCCFWQAALMARRLKSWKKTRLGRLYERWGYWHSRPPRPPLGRTLDMLSNTPHQVMYVKSTMGPVHQIFF